MKTHMPIHEPELPFGHPGRNFDDTPEPITGYCLHCRREITATGSVEWRRVVRQPCPHCGKLGW